MKAQQKQQLMELSLQREQERQRAARDHRAAVSQLKAETERMVQDLKKVHAAETEKALDKVRKSSRAASCGTASGE